MAITVSVQPSEETVVRFVQRPNEPPLVVVTDGSAAVWFCPYAGPAGAELAAEFAERLATVVSRWSEACRGLAEPARQRPYVSEGR